MTSAAKRITELREEIRKHDRNYYELDRPTIEDRDYDRLMEELTELEKKHPDLVTADSPTMKVGGDVQNELPPVQHAVPMLSIDNTYKEEDLRKWAERCYRNVDPGIRALDRALSEIQAQLDHTSGSAKRHLAEEAKSLRAKITEAVEVGRKNGFPIGYVLEPKIDGTSINLRYVGGTLVLGATRGRGNVGDDVTFNARRIQSIPQILTRDTTPPPPDILEVRGEVYMDNEDFQRLNKQIEAKGGETYANPRNLASGTLKRKDPRIVESMSLKFLAHGLGEVSESLANSYSKWIHLLRSWKFPLPDHISIAKNIDEAVGHIQTFESTRSKMPYMTDGMVVKLDSLEYRKILGATSKSPRWVVAYKYETEQQPAVLKNVRWQVGKGGNLTPVGELEPVFIGGVTVTNVTLHNIDQIKRLGLHFGDTVVVERAGEVIPYVVEAVTEKRPKDAARISVPRTCPSCHSKVVHEPGSPHVRCTNPDCPGQLRERLIWFVGRGQMDIDGLGEKIIEQLLESGKVKSFADIFTLGPEDLAGLKHETQLGDKKATEIVNSIQQSVPLWTRLKDTPEYQLRAETGLSSYLRWLSSPKRLNWQRMGDKTIDQLISTGTIRTVEGVFGLTPEKLSGLVIEVALGEKTAKKIVANIEKAKTCGLSRLLSALGIRLVGDTAARQFAAWAGDMSKLSSAPLDQLVDVLAKDPEQKKKSLAKERNIAERLYCGLHPNRQKNLFETSALESNIHEKYTGPFLRKRDEALPHKERLFKTRIEKLNECFPTVADLISATEEDLCDCLQSGVAVARSLHDYLHSEAGRKTIRDLRDAGLDMTEKRAVDTASKWTNKIVVITGSFEGFPRDQIKQRLLALGARVTESVSSKTDVVFVGADPGTKRDKAIALNLEIRGEEEVRELMTSP